MEINAMYRTIPTIRVRGGRYTVRIDVVVGAMTVAVLPARRKQPI